MMPRAINQEKKNEGGIKEMGEYISCGKDGFGQRSFLELIFLATRGKKYFVGKQGDAIRKRAHN